MSLFKKKEGKAASAAPARKQSPAAPARKQPLRGAKDTAGPRPPVPPKAKKEKKARPAKPARPKPNKEIPSLVKALGAGRWPECEHAAAKLSGIGAEAVDPLCRALKDRNVIVGWNAAFVLGWIADRAAVEPLCEMLDHDNAHLRESAVRALGLIGDAAATQPLVRKLAGEKESAVRLAIVDTLEKIADPGASEALAGILNDPDLHVRLAVVKALGKMGVLHSVTIHFPGFEISSSDAPPVIPETPAPGTAGEEPAPAPGETPAAEKPPAEAAGAEAAADGGEKPPAAAGEGEKPPDAAAGKRYAVEDGEGEKTESAPGRSEPVLGTVAKVVESAGKQE